MGLFIGTKAELAASRKPKGKAVAKKKLNNFEKSFAQARRSGKSTFSFGGKSYNTKVADARAKGGGKPKVDAGRSKPMGGTPPGTNKPGTAPAPLKKLNPNDIPSNYRMSELSGPKRGVPLPKSAPRSGLPASGVPLPKSAPRPNASTSVPKPMPGRTGEILRVAERNKTNPPPANNADVMKRVQDSIAVGKSTSSYPARPATVTPGRGGVAQSVAPTIENVSAAARARKPGSPAGPRGAQVQGGDRLYLTSKEAASEDARRFSARERNYISGHRQEQARVAQPPGGGVFKKMLSGVGAKPAPAAITKPPTAGLKPGQAVPFGKPDYVKPTGKPPLVKRAGADSAPKAGPKTAITKRKVRVIG